MKCLLVDDEPGIREGLAALLRLRGHEVRTAEDVASALRELGDHSFELVLSDWRLPDGTAAPLLARSAAPVVVVSGHPEEVEATPPPSAVLAKPVAPDRLLALMAHLGDAAGAVERRAAERRSVAPESLPRDVGDVLARALALLAADAVEVLDDGTFVTLRAPWPGDEHLPVFEALGGDLRILAPGGRSVLELRWCRDGRPDPGLPVVRVAGRPETPWPETAELCVDFDGSDAGGAGDTAVTRFLAALDEAATRRARGDRVWFLNVPPALRQAAAGRPVPTPERIGPVLPAELADLWR